MLHAAPLAWLLALAAPSTAPALEGTLLLGTVVSPAAGRSSALLRVGERARVVGVGDSVQGARVAVIGADLVVLEGPAGTRELRLSAVAPPTAAAVPAPMSGARDEPGVVAFARAELERRIAEESPRLLAETSLIPVTEDGRTTGFTLGRLPENSLLTEVGLQPGDVLTEINGTPVDSVATLLALYGRLRGESEVRAGVLRGGSPLTLVLRLR